MSDFKPQGTIKERLTRIEIMLCNHLEDHKKAYNKQITREKWLFGILSAVCISVILKCLPSILAWIASVL
jgi:hypothetical protein